MKHSIFSFLCALGFTSTAFSLAISNQPDLHVVPHVDLQRYLGKWYEIASIPQIFSLNCVASTATYSLRTDGDILVDNACHDKDFNGPVREVVGKARVVDTMTNAKLKVQFFWPFWGSYWIIDLGENYEYAVVGHASRQFLWILSRTPTIETNVYSGILDRVSAQGYDIKRLSITPQL